MFLIPIRPGDSGRVELPQGKSTAKFPLLLLCGSVYLSMPRHDYVKSGRLAVTEKTKPINIYLHI